jgi:hypothetical protein
MNRRTFLRRTAIGGGALIVAGTGAGGWRAAQAGLILPDKSPFAPWDALADARPGDPAGLAAAAILASNPHNTQPWRITAGPERFVIAADTARHLGAFDPFRREMWIGLGAAIANAEIAAGPLGFRSGPTVIEALGPEGAGRISMALDPAAPVADPLFDALPRRKTNRSPYAQMPVGDDRMQSVLALVGAIDGARLVLLGRTGETGALFADATVAATQAITADAEMSHDGHVWYRANARDVAAHRDGVSIPTAGLSPLITVLGQLMPEPDDETSGRYWLRSTQGQVEATAGFGIIAVDDLDDRAGQIAAGRLWQRLHLAFTTEGLAAHPLNQLPEMVDRDRQLGRDGGWRATLHRLTGGAGQATFAFRYGVPLSDVPHSARRPLDWIDAGA